MLNIALPELTAGAEEQVLAHQARLGVDERHHVLQLIAETERAARTGSIRCAPTRRQARV